MATEQQSSIEKASEIIQDLRQSNYGNAERKAIILLLQLEDEQQEQRETDEAIRNALEETTRITKRHCDMAEQIPKEPDVFERQIMEFLTNLEKLDVKSVTDYDYYEGMKNAYRYALAVYQRTER